MENGRKTKRKPKKENITKALTNRIDDHCITDDGKCTNKEKEEQYDIEKRMIRR